VGEGQTWSSEDTQVCPAFLAPARRLHLLGVLTYCTDSCCPLRGFAAEGLLLAARLPFNCEIRVERSTRARRGLDSGAKIGVKNRSVERLFMTTLLLIIHGLMAVALLGAVTHQAISVLLPARKASDSFVGRMRAVSAPSYVTAIVVLYVATATLGGVIYPEYRLSIRVVLEQLDLWKANGAFELKEHFAALGLGMLPAYWYFWRQPLAANYAPARTMMTITLAFIVWWSFFVGHILNNIRGFGA
jgi:hypothetical protein